MFIYISNHCKPAKSVPRKLGLIRSTLCMSDYTKTMDNGQLINSKTEFFICVYILVETILFGTNDK